MPPNTDSAGCLSLEYEEDLPANTTKGWRTGLNIYVNGKKMTRELSIITPTMTLLSFLRQNGLTGTKLGCAEGGCGACTAIVSRETSDGSVRHRSVNACLFPAVAADCCHVTTVEGLGSTR